MVAQRATYEAAALAQPERRLEWHDGALWEREPVTIDHSDMASFMAFSLQSQLDPTEFRVHVNHDRLRRSNTSVYIPDVIVVPIALARALRGQPLAIFDDPLPLVIEVRSPSTGRIDFHEKLPEYQRRGDQEIWWLHPIELWLRAWVRQEDGSYKERAYGPDDEVCPAYLPGVVIRLTELRLV